MTSTSSASDLRALPLVAALLLGGCFANHHYVDDPKQMDGVFFGWPKSIPRSEEFRSVEDSIRNNYFVFGLSPASEEGISFGGVRLSQMCMRGNGGTVTNARVHTVKSFGSGLLEFGCWFLPPFILLQGFLFNFRDVEVTASTTSTRVQEDLNR